MTEEQRAAKRLRDKEYYHRNKDKYAESNKRNYIKNREARLEYAKSYYSQNKDDSEFIERSKATRRKSYEKNIDQKSEYQKQYWYKLKTKAMESVGELSCKSCGFNDDRALQIDHISGGGRQHIRSFTSNKTYLYFVIENPTMFQILCANCNFIKRHENNEFRKSKVKTA